MTTADVPYQQFHCPKCGAPGHVTWGVASYSCHCRLQAFASGPQLVTLTEDAIRQIVRDELGKNEVQK